MDMHTAITAFCAEHPDEGRRIFDARITRETDPARVADLELWREYLCDPSFRRALADYVASVNGEEVQP